MHASSEKAADIRSASKEEIILDGELCAIIIAANYDEEGIRFFTSGDLSQQLASMSYPRGKGRWQKELAPEHGMRRLEFITKIGMGRKYNIP